MTTEYDDSNIRVLEGLEAVRIRPGMYIGSTGSKGLHNLVYEVVDNSIEEAIAGYCQNIDVSINTDGSVTVIDNGRGIPAGINPRTGKSTIEVIFTVLCACGNHHEGYKISGGVHGVGLAVVSALSSQLEVKVWRNQKIHNQRFEKGIAVSEFKVSPLEEDRTGTMVTFLPDPEIFTESIEFDFDTLNIRLRELAYLNPGLKLSLTDDRDRTAAPRVERYCYDRGIRDYVADLNADKQPLADEVIYIHGERDGVKVEVAMQWCDREEDWIFSFVNTVRTVDGGTHLEGLKMALTRTIDRIARQRNLIQDGHLKGEYIREGLTAIVSILHPNPEYEGSTRTKLSNAQAQGIVDSIVSDGLDEYFTVHPDVSAIVIRQAIQAAITDEMRKKERTLLCHRRESDRDDVGLFCIKATFAPIF